MRNVCTDLIDSEQHLLVVTFYPPMFAAFVPISSINRLATCSLCSRPGVPTGCNSASDYVDSNRSKQFCATATVSTDALLHSSKTLELRFFATDGVAGCRDVEASVSPTIRQIPLPGRANPTCAPKTGGETGRDSSPERASFFQLAQADRETETRAIIRGKMPHRFPDEEGIPPVLKATHSTHSTWGERKQRWRTEVYFMR